MPVVITEEVTLADIDETIAYVNQLLKTDTYGNRMDWKKKEDLQTFYLEDVKFYIIEQN
jgi:hypothetical protein